MPSVGRGAWVLVLALGASASILAFLVLHRSETSAFTGELDRRGLNMGRRIAQSLAEHDEALYELGDLHAASPALTRPQFNRLADSVLSRQRGIRALEWAPRVSVKDRTSFEAAVRAGDLTEFRLKDRTDQPTDPRAAGRSDIFPVLYATGGQGNDAAVGYDLMSGPPVDELLDRITASGKIGASPVFPLLDGRPKAAHSGFQVYLPVYATGEIPATPEGRRAALRGFLVGVYDLSDLIESMFEGIQHPGVNMVFLDRSARAPDTPMGTGFLYFRPSTPGTRTPSLAEITTGPYYGTNIDSGGLEWRVLFRASPGDTIAPTTQWSWIVLGFGLATTGLAAFVVHLGQKSAAAATRYAFERKLLEGQKLESIGILAGGIAHEFNNLLTVIIGNAELVREFPPSAELPRGQCLRQIISTSQRAAELCRQMLTFAGQKPVVASSVDLSAVVREMVPLLDLSIHHRATLKLELTEELPSVRADITQMRHVIMNFVTNASEAIGENMAPVSPTEDAGAQA